MTLLKDLIEILEQVQKGDFVPRLTEGVIRADETLRDYVVTPELIVCFDNALSFIRSALQSNTSKATYLHGSFGSGKSHFMAVLHLILQGNARLPTPSGLGQQDDPLFSGIPRDVLTSMPFLFARVVLLRLFRVLGTLHWSFCAVQNDFLDLRKALKKFLHASQLALWQRLFVA